MADVRTYRLACGECARCLARVGEGKPLTEIQRAALYGLNQLARPASTTELVAPAKGYMGRDACEGGWQDTLNRAPWALAERGLFSVEMEGKTRTWALTSLGRATLVADGQQPRVATPRPATLFG